MVNSSSEEAKNEESRDSKESDRPRRAHTQQVGVQEQLASIELPLTVKKHDTDDKGTNKFSLNSSASHSCKPVTKNHSVIKVARSQEGISLMESVWHQADVLVTMPTMCFYKVVEFIYTIPCMGVTTGCDKGVVIIEVELYDEHTEELHGFFLEQKSKLRPVIFGRMRPAEEEDLGFNIEYLMPTSTEGEALLVFANLFPDKQ